jgi:hypothetical protein
VAQGLPGDSEAVAQQLGAVHPVLDYDLEIRTVLCSTNAIESLNARYRRAVNAKGHFPTEQAAIKTLYLVTRSLDPKGARTGTMGDPMEAGPERRLRGPVAGSGEPLTTNARYTVHLTDSPAALPQASWSAASTC